VLTLSPAEKAESLHGDIRVPVGVDNPHPLSSEIIWYSWMRLPRRVDVADERRSRIVSFT